MHFFSILTREPLPSDYAQGGTLLSAYSMTLARCPEIVFLFDDFYDTNSPFSIDLYSSQNAVISVHPNIVEILRL